MKQDQIGFGTTHKAAFWFMDCLRATELLLMINNQLDLSTGWFCFLFLCEVVTHINIQTLSSVAWVGFLGHTTYYRESSYILKL